MLPGGIGRLLRLATTSAQNRKANPAPQRNSNQKYLDEVGDPETQAVLGLIDEDLLEIFYDVACGDIKHTNLRLKKQSAVCVVISSEGYPENPVKGDEIFGIDRVDGDVMVYHAGTKLENGRYFTNGGRVLNVVAYGDVMEEARKRAYENISRINFRGMHYRKDIADKALNR